MSTILKTKVSQMSTDPVARMHAQKRMRRAMETTVRNTNFASAPGAASHAVGYALHPSVDFLHRVLALMTAFVAVFGAYGILDREFGAATLGAVVYSASAGAALGGIFIGATTECEYRTERIHALSALKKCCFPLVLRRVQRFRCPLEKMSAEHTYDR